MPERNLCCLEKNSIKDKTKGLALIKTSKPVYLCVSPSKRKFLLPDR